MKKIILFAIISTFLLGACKGPTATESSLKKEEMPEGAEEVTGTPENADPRQTVYKGKRYRAPKAGLKQYDPGKAKQKEKVNPKQD